MSRSRVKPKPAQQAELTERQQKLHETVVATSEDPYGQAQLIWTLALRVGASTRDVKAVQELLARAGS